MAQPGTSPRTVRFGVYEVDLVNTELRKGGLRVRIQEQPFQILAALLEQPGEVISRESLVRRLWPDGTFVDFERGLNAAVTRLRQTLSDNAENPRYVETVSRRGYRFIAPVEPVTEPARLPEERIVQSHRGRFAWLAAALLLVSAAAGAIWLLTRKQPTTDRLVTATPLTTYPGFERAPSFSPDGNQVAFVWDKGDGEPHIYVKFIGPGEPLRLTSGSGTESGPVWSRDGRQIAFVRQVDRNKMAVFVVPPLRGVERKVAEVTQSFTIVANSRAAQPRSVDWTIDGTHLVVSGGNDPGVEHGLFLLSLETGDRRLVTNPRESAEVADRSPSVSPDGQMVAFCRGASIFAGDLFVASLSSNVRDGAEPRRLTTDARYCASPAWTTDGRGLVFVSNRDGDQRLWKVSADGKSAPRRLADLGIDTHDPAVSQKGKLAYAHHVLDNNIWRQQISSRSDAVGPPVNLIASTSIDQNPQYSPTDGRIAFQSWRSGNSEIWVCGANGSQCWQLTAMNGPQTGTPRWSPDGKRITFDSAASGNFDIYLIDANGGSPQRLTNDPTDDAVPSWSADGKWIYYTAARTGESQIWKVPAGGGIPVQVTRQGGFTAFEAPDGRTLYYTRTSSLSKLLKSAIDGSGETVVVDGVIGRGFVIRDDRLYYLHSEPGGMTAIRCLMLGTGRDSLITFINKPVAPGLSVSPDGKYLLYSQVDHGGSDLMLVEHFK